MPDNPRVEQLLEELLDTGGTPEEACRTCPELLPQVRAGWQRLRALQAEVGALFPPSAVPDGPPPPPPPTADLPRIPGYEVQEVLGRGGMGVVYKAWHRRLQRPVAVKMLLAGAYAGPEELERFLREAEAVAGLRHANVVQVYDIGDLDGRPYFTMEYVEGGSLAQKLAGTPQPADQAAALVATLAEAVHVAHQSGIVHRDLKPGNILLRKKSEIPNPKSEKEDSASDFGFRISDFEPKVTDFGLARRLEGGGGLTLTGVPVGTPSYMAPEQAQSQRDAIGPATDVYALGAILYELLTGRPPFVAETAAATLQLVLAEDPVPPARLNPRLPRDLETICLKCLHKEPPRRYASAAALAEDLRRQARGEPITARPAGRLERLVREVRKRPVLAMATLSVVALLGGGLWLIAERRAAERVATAERQTTERAARDDLREMAAELQQSRWPLARTALERAKGRLGDHGSPEVRRLLDQGSRDLALAARVEKIRLDYAHATVVAPEQADEQYEEAFRGAGLGQVADDPELVAARVRASNIRSALVGALDHWSQHAVGLPRRSWVLTVARQADTGPDPSGWRDRGRDPAVWTDQAALLGVIRAAPAADPRVPLLLALAVRLRHDSPERLAFLKRIQQNHAGDFWANLTLGDAMTQEDPVEASRYYQAAVSLRPDLALGYDKLGWSLFLAGLPEDAVAAFQKAAELDPAAVRTHHILAVTLGILGRHDEALAHLQAAIAANPTEGSLHWAMGMTLKFKGRYADALTHYRKAVALNPNDQHAQDLLRAHLVRLGQGDKARRAWHAALAAGPPGDEAWCGYAEFCLYLGQEDEYRRTRRTLLDHFGASTDPQVAGRTARACLLLPASGDELRQAVALAERAVAGEPSKYRCHYPHFLFAQGLAEYRQGRFERAIAAMRGEAVDALGPASRLVLAMALHQSGRAAEGREAFKAAVAAHDWKADELASPNNWVYHVLRREAEGMILPNLRAFLDGRCQPSDNDERLALLGVCQDTNRVLALARLYANVFRADPRLAEDLAAGHRANAARAAALAGCGLGKDSAGLAGPERRRWRVQAREWLRADLAAWGKLLDGGQRRTRDQVLLAVQGWRSDPALSGLREPTELDKLSADERKDCLALWHEVGVLLARIRGNQ
jgi:tetratricopeptide (TPR) repeat protein